MLGRANAAAGGQKGLFDRIAWFEALHGACLAEHAPLIGEASDESGNKAWLFLVRKGPVLASMAHWYSFSWRPVWGGKPDEDDKARLLGALGAGLKNHGARLALSPVPAADNCAETLGTALARSGWLVTRHASSHNHWLEPAGRSFAAWWADRPGALRSTVQRKGKKGLVALSITNRFSDADWADFETVYAQSWKPAEGFPDFLRDWARAEGDAGTLRLGMARIDGAPVAAQFWSCDHGVAYIHKLSHIAGHDALSPGTLLTHALFAHAFDVDKVARIDFGTGDDGYKRDWMDHSAPLMTIAAFDPRQAATWPALARHGLSRLAARLRDR